MEIVSYRSYFATIRTILSGCYVFNPTAQQSLACRNSSCQAAAYADLPLGKEVTELWRAKVKSPHRRSHPLQYVLHVPRVLLFPRLIPRTQSTLPSWTGPVKSALLALF